jgi:hypothetical protein
MGKMTPEKAAKMLADEGLVATGEEAAQILDFLCTLAKIIKATTIKVRKKIYCFNSRTQL